jgi:hypothetical protein
MRTTTLVALTTTKAVIFNDLAKCAPHPSADVNGDQAAGLMVELSVGIFGPDQPHGAALNRSGAAVRPHNEKLTSRSGSTSCLPIQALPDLRGRITKRESSGPLSDGSFALPVNDITSDPKRDKHAYE